MELHSMICPKCGGQIYFEEEQESCFCSHCGTQIYKNNPNKKSFTYRTIDDARIKESENNRDIRLKELENEQKEKKFENKFLVGMWIFLGFLIVAGWTVLIKTGLDDEKKAEQLVEQGMVSAGYYEDYSGKNYKYAVSILEGKGFTNIEAISLDDADTEKKVGEVDSISIAGDVHFGSKDYYDPGVKVTVFYH